MPARSVLLFVALAALGCRATLPAVPQELIAHAEHRSQAESLLGTVDAVVGAGWNLGRREAVEERARVLGLGDSIRTEWIDWFSLQKNVLIELPGRSERVIYLVAHYDKTDVNPFKFASLLVNGLLDELIAPSYFGEGAIDNATGVAVVLETAKALRDRERHFRYRFLLTGSEESGLRGARAHVARLSRQERDAVEIAINVDTVGLASSPNCVSKEVSRASWKRRARDAADALGVPLDEGSLPYGAAGDHDAFRPGFWRDLGRSFLFNLPGALLPQRSYFARASEIPVVAFHGCEVIDWTDYVGSQVLLPLGRIHGPRDRASRIDPRRLWEQYSIIVRMLEDFEPVSP